MKRPTRFLAVAGTLLVLVLALLFVLPLLFRDRIAQRRFNADPQQYSTEFGPRSVTVPMAAPVVIERGTARVRSKRLVR